MQLEHLAEDSCEDPALRRALATLSTRCFQGYTFREADVHPADHRWLVKTDEKIVGHAAVQKRGFQVNGIAHQGWGLGSVCVDPRHQGNGLGRELMQRLFLDLHASGVDFIILNCGEEYIRPEENEIDEDPILAIGLNPEFNLAVLKTKVFPVGEDY